MYKPGDLIQATSPLSIANVRYADRLTDCWYDAITACSVMTGTLATVIGSWKIDMDGRRSNELYILLTDGQQGWTYGECWRRPTPKWVKSALEWCKLGR